MRMVKGLLTLVAGACLWSGVQADPLSADKAWSGPSVPADAPGHGIEQHRGETDKMHELKLQVGSQVLTVSWEQSRSVGALQEAVENGPLTLELSAYGGFEQVGELGLRLPHDDVYQTARPGDIMLYQGNKLVLFFGSNAWSYTRLGHIEGKSQEELRSLLDRDRITLSISKP